MLIVFVYRLAYGFPVDVARYYGRDKEREARARNHPSADRTIAVRPRVRVRHFWLFTPTPLKLDEVEALDSGDMMSAPTVPIDVICRP